MIGDQRQHDGRLVVCIEIGPIHRHHDGGAGADDVGHPQGQDFIDLDAVVGQQPVNLFGRVLGRQAARRREAMSDRGDGERCTVQDTEGGVAQAFDAFGMQIVFEHAAEHAVHRVEREPVDVGDMGGHDLLRAACWMAAGQTRQVGPRGKGLGKIAMLLRHRCLPESFRESRSGWRFDYSNARQRAE